MDTDDLQTILETTTKQAIVNVCENLLKGSRNHLKAFVGQIDLLGGNEILQSLIS
jgi:hypothetical protein